MRQFQRVHEAERTSSRICRRLRLLAVMGILRRYVSAIRWAFDSPSQRERERERERLVLCASITEYREIDIFFTIWQKGNSSEYTYITYIYIYIYIVSIYIGESLNRPGITLGRLATCHDHGGWICDSETGSSAMLLFGALSVSG